MGTIAGHGVAVALPSGWEGRIFGAPPGSESAAATPRTASANGPARLHAANFALPADIGDFGSGAVDIMTNAHVLVVLFEFGPESVGQPLFTAQGVPTLAPADFSPTALRKLINGQGGVQRFFTVSGRPFSLYVVVGSFLRRFRTVPLVNEVLRAVTVT